MLLLKILSEAMTKEVNIKLILLFKSYRLKIILQLNKFKPVWDCTFVFYMMEEKLVYNCEYMK